jgi:hypothetical protein
MRKSNYILEKNRFWNAFVKNNLSYNPPTRSIINRSSGKINFRKNNFRDLVFSNYYIALYSTIDTSVHFNKQVTNITLKTVD